MSAMTIEEVLKKYTDNLMSLSGVIGTGQGLFDGKSCIKVFVVKKTPELEDKIPEKLEGYPVKIKETGVIRAEL
ncbi:MAG: hypothetical protein JRE72_13795 [Deltaproteobacteria bacterium]|jgi:hypothetical protein|nr:hypothetical protein [Deltaproteobacteria bacterium]